MEVENICGEPCVVLLKQEYKDILEELERYKERRALNVEFTYEKEARCTYGYVVAQDLVGLSYTLNSERDLRNLVDKINEKLERLREMDALLTNKNTRIQERLAAFNDLPWYKKINFKF